MLKVYVVWVKCTKDECGQYRTSVAQGSVYENIRTKCPSFVAMDCNVQFCAIFQKRIILWFCQLRRWSSCYQQGIIEIVHIRGFLKLFKTKCELLALAKPMYEQLSADVCNNQRQKWALLVDFQDFCVEYESLNDLLAKNKLQVLFLRSVATERRGSRDIFRFWDQNFNWLSLKQHKR